MKKMKDLKVFNNVIYIIIFIIALIFLHEPFIILFSNVNCLMKKDNKSTLINNSYKNKVDLLEKEIAKYEESMNNLKIYEGNSYILAKVSIRDIYDFFDYIYISTDKKVKINSPVINEDGLVGIVIEADENTSKVKLLTNYNNISVKISSSYGLTSTYDKKNNLLLIKNINNYEKINIGDEVLTSGLSSIPGGLNIGKVVNIVTKGIEKEVYVRPYVDFNNLNYLYVITS